jgi:hypothetical protein
MNRVMGSHHRRNHATPIDQLFGKKFRRKNKVGDGNARAAHQMTEIQMITEGQQATEKMRVSE